MTIGEQLFEMLEARIVLSGVYYEWVGVETLPGYAAEYGEPDAIAGMSENGRFMWSSAAADRDYPDEPYIVDDGVVKYLRDLPVLDDSEIGGINSFGVLFATDTSGADAGRHFVLDLSTDSTRAYFDEQALQAPEGFDITASEPWAVTDGGVFLLAGPGAVRRELWAIIDDRVERLWEGQPGDFWNAEGLYVDSNSQSLVVGYGRDDNGLGIPMMWSPAGGVTDLRAAGYSDVGSVNDDGSVLVSVQYEGSLVLLREGVAYPVEFSHDGVGRPRGRDAQGTYIFRIPDGHPQYGHSQDIFSTTGGLVDIRVSTVRDMRIVESGLIFHGAEDRSGWFAPTDGLSFYKSSAGESATIWQNEGALEVYTRFQDGGSVRYVSDGSGGWSPDWRRFNAIGSNEDLGREFMQNPATGNGLLLAEIVDGWTSFGTNEPEDGYAQSRVFNWLDQLGGQLTGFFNHESRPVVSGYDATGNLMLLYVVGGGRGDSRVVNLSVEHIAQQSLDNPIFTSNLDSFVTPWGAMNIVGLDEAGDLHAVWWSPGLGSPLWTTTNLSDITGVPKLIGNIVGSATAWSGMQVMGTDERGNLISIWWSPSSGGWRWDDLTAEAGGVALEAGSIDGATTPWGAIEVVGRTADNELVTYWWAPDPGGWVFESITAQQVGDVPRITGPVSLVVANDGSQHIAGVSAEGEVIHLYWLPDGSDLWRAENLTALAIR